MKKLTTILFLLISLAGITQKLNFQDVIIYEVNNHGTVISVQFPQSNIQIEVLDSIIVFSEENFCGNEIKTEEFQILTKELTKKTHYFTTEKDGEKYTIELPTKKRWFVVIKKNNSKETLFISARFKHKTR